MGGLSPLVSQYQQWNQGRPTGNLPRPSNIFTDATFAPLTPIIGPGINTPNQDQLTDPRRYEFQVGWNMPIGIPGSESGSGKLAPFQALRNICELYSVAAACIDLRISEIRGLGWDITPTTEAEKAMQGNQNLLDDFAKRRAEALRFWKRPDSNYFDFSTWLCAVLYDIFSVDALALYQWPSMVKGKGLLGSNLSELALIDGTTIRPMVDVFGNRPKPPNIAYQQYLYGVPRTDMMTVPDPARLLEGEDEDLVAEYRSNQLMYLPYYGPRSNGVYGFAPIERALIPAMSGLQRQKYQLDYYTEGTIPGVFVSPGDANMTHDQQRTLQDALNSLAGDPAWKHKIIVLPPGSNVNPQKPASLADQYDEILMTELCMAFGVMPMELGISPKVSTTQSPGASNQMAKASESINQRKSLKPLLLFLKDCIFDNVLQNICGQADMEWTWEGIEQGTDEEAQLAIIVGKINAGLLTVDEGRSDLGLQTFGLPMTTEPVVMTPTGYLALGHIDPDTGKPIGDLSSQPQADAGAAPGESPPDNGPGGTPAKKPPVKPGGSGGGAASPTPGHSSATVANDAADTQVGSKPGAGGGGSNTKAALAELDQLRRRLKQGRPIDDWECKSIGKGVLQSLLYGLKMGEDPVDLIDKARKSINDEEVLSRREDVLAQVKADVASGLGKLANGLRTGKIAGPYFVSEGVNVMTDGIAAAYRLGAGHALSDRGHPGHLMHGKVLKPKKPVQAVTAPHQSSYEDLTGQLNNYWDSQAQDTADSGRHFLENLMTAVTVVAVGATVASVLASRLDLYANQVQAAYEQAYGTTAIAASEARALANGEPPTVDADGNETDPGSQIITWHTTDAEVCDLCTDRDEQQYTIDTLPGWPGDGYFGDLCEGGPNCKCYLTYDDVTADNTIRTDGYAAERAGQAADQSARMQQVNDLRSIFVQALPDSASARAAERDAARQQLATEMGAAQGYTAWPADVAASDVRDRVGAQNS